MDGAVMMPSLIVYILAFFGLLWSTIFTYFLVKVVIAKMKDL